VLGIARLVAAIVPAVSNIKFDATNKALIKSSKRIKDATPPKHQS
jgi:hypothetical protein